LISLDILSSQHFSIRFSLLYPSPFFSHIFLSNILYSLAFTVAGVKLSPCNRRRVLLLPCCYSPLLLCTAVTFATVCRCGTVALPLPLYSPLTPSLRRTFSSRRIAAVAVAAPSQCRRRRCRIVSVPLSLS
jgi:hypothetical protein